MASKVSIRNLQIITALDSLSYGIIYSFISPYVLKLGASHFHIGILAIGNLLGELLSPEVAKIFTHLNGKRYTLFVILNTAMVTHLMLVLTNSYWFTILVRILFSFTNQSQSICYDLLINKAQSDSDKEKLRSNYSVLSGLGYILGPIISGHLFDKGFGYTGALAALLTLINAVLLTKVEKNNKDTNPEHLDKSVLEKAADKVVGDIENFRKSDYKKHWDILLMKYLFAASVMIFFSKFSQLLKFNYNATSVTVGYTTSYINILVFAATYFLPFLKSHSEIYPEGFLSEGSFFLQTILLILACYAPYYELYMLLLIPIIFIRAFVTSLWKDLFSERKDSYIIKLNNSASIVSGLSIPVFFGIICDKIAKDAVILFSCIPIFLCWIITRYYSRNLKIDATTAKEKEQ